MEKPMPNKHSRRHSTGNLMLELTGYEGVLSRYLSAPFPSCHDNCKPHSPGSDHPTQTKPTRKRSNKSDADSVQGLKKPFTPIPKSPTIHAKIASTSHAKHRQNFKSRSRSKSADADPFFIPPTRITRRFSDVNLPANSSNDAHVSPAGGGLVSGKNYDKKSDSRKDVKPINSAVKKPDVKPVKSILKTPEVKQVKSAVKMPRDGTNSNKVQNLKTIFSSTKPRVDRCSKNSKSAQPVGEVVQEKSNKCPSQNEERVLQNGAQIASKQEKEQTPGTESQSNSNIATPTVKKTQLRKQAKENEELSSQKLNFKHGKVIASQSETDGPTKLEFVKGELLDEKKSDEEEGKRLRRLTSDGVIQTPESSSVNVVLKPCDTEEKKRNTRVNKVIEETAGRLIRARKSKVQALVGAFEMVSANEF